MSVGIMNLGGTLPSHLYQTWSLVRPAGPAYWRRGTCEEAGCLHWRNGWVTRVPATGPQVAYILKGAGGRTYTETTGLDQAGRSEREFRFAPGQTCFGTEHRVPIEREPLYIVRNGRVERGGIARQHARGEDWRDDMGENLDKLREQHKREME